MNKLQTWTNKEQQRVSEIVGSLAYVQGDYSTVFSICKTKLRYFFNFFAIFN